MFEGKNLPKEFKPMIEFIDWYQKNQKEQQLYLISPEKIVECYRNSIIVQKLSS